MPRARALAEVARSFRLESQLGAVATLGISTSVGLPDLPRLGINTPGGIRIHIRQRVLRDARRDQPARRVTPAVTSDTTVSSSVDTIHPETV